MLPSADVTLLTRRDAAVLLGVPPAMVERLERKGRLSPRRTLGGGRYYLREDVERVRGEHAAAAVGALDG
jgi:DNA-binding transcriptional MerR regulator